MGRPADQIEALQGRVRELEGRCRALFERASGAVELLREIEWNGRSAGEHTCPCCDGLEGDHYDCKLAALIGPVDAPPADVPPVLVAGEALDEGRAAWFAEIGLKAPTPEEAARAAADDDDEAPTP